MYVKQIYGQIKEDLASLETFKKNLNWSLKLN